MKPVDKYVCKALNLMRPYIGRSAPKKDDDYLRTIFPKRATR